MMSLVIRCREEAVGVNPDELDVLACRLVTLGILIPPKVATVPVLEVPAAR
jgi:hypothetical protein